MAELAVREFLKSIPKNEVIYYRSNPGNAGDALIASGAYKLFDEAGLKVELVDPNNFDASGKIVFYAGGGNLTGIYPEAREFFQKFHKHAKQLVLLPHTVAKNEDLLGELGSNVTLFARELVSLEHLKKHCNAANVYLDHDLAFNLDAREILSRKLVSFPEVIFRKAISRFNGKGSSLSSQYPRPQIMLRNTIYETRRLLNPFPDGHGLFYRTDAEGLSKPTSERKDDLSRIYEYGTQYRSLTDYTTARMMKFINRYSQISTDRLHVCIAATLLGKSVNFYSNSYYKCEAVYAYSLRDFKNVTWLGSRNFK